MVVKQKEGEKMYFVCADEVINKKQEEVYNQNKKLIKDFEEMPFWRRWNGEDELNGLIRRNWLEFEWWMNQRISRKESGSRD